MNILERIKQNSYKYDNEKWNELKNTFLEMSIHKSEFDMEKFTVKKEGNFIAHNYHFLIRQYSLAMSELRKYTLNKEEKVRQIEELKDLGKTETKTSDGKYIDIEIKRKENEIDNIDMSIANKAYSCDYMEKLRLKLVELNGGKEPTNAQWQEEAPDYYKWFLEREMYYDIVSRQTGLRIGVTNNIDLLEEKPLLNTDFQRKIEKIMDVNKHQIETEKNKTIDNRYNNMIEEK